MDDDEVVRLAYTKGNMFANGKLKDRQTKKYVMYYIFHNEEPVYVGVTNSFDRRKNEHFSEMHRKKHSDKRLYEHMSNNDIECYEMYIVLQTKTAKSIEELESFHISELRSLKFDITNKSSGGGYTDFVNRSVRDNVRKFVDTFRKIENLSVECYDEFIFDIDTNKLGAYMKKLDWALLRSVEEYRAISVTEAYDDFLRKSSYKKIKDEDEIDFDDYINGSYTLPNKLSVSSLFDEVFNGSLVSESGKNSAICRFMDLVDHLENSDDSIEVFVALKIIMGYDYQDDILPVICEYDSWDYYELESYIKGYGREFEEEYLYYDGGNT